MQIPDPKSTSALYLDRIAEYGKSEQRLRRLVGSVSIGLQAGSACTALAGAAIFLKFGLLAMCAAVSGLLCGLTALLLLRDRKLCDLRRVEQLRIINEQSLARINRLWDDFPAPSYNVPEAFETTAADLDVFGHASVFQLLCTAETTEGIRCLGNWLTEPAPADIVKERQTSVARLAPELDLRQKLQVYCRLLAKGRVRPADFLEWAESERPQFFSPQALWLARMSSSVAALLIVALSVELSWAYLTATALLAVVGTHVIVTVVYGGKVYDVFRAASSGAAEADLHQRLYRLAARFPAESALLKDITTQAATAICHMQRLRRIAELASLRRWWVAYFPLQFLFLWDFHVLDLMERWKMRSGRLYRGWFEALGQLEALCSLAGLAGDNPDWAFPTIAANSSKVIEADAIGHPLLPEGVRVVNDVVVGPPGEVLMVTGSNMSGKSTLLRSLGLNIILAQSGAPVCARRMTLPSIALVTVMRVADSLERGTSLFMAELRRLRHVVERADVAAADRDRQLCYLLDEILHGTNSAERHIACVRILERLIAAGAIGAVSTHDLALCQAAPIADRSRHVHFRETILTDGEHVQMTFDYRLRPGVATTTNVSYLLNAVGLTRVDETVGRIEIR